MPPINSWIDKHLPDRRKLRFMSSSTIPNFIFRGIEDANGGTKTDIWKQRLRKARAECRQYYLNESSPSLSAERTRHCWLLQTTQMAGNAGTSMVFEARRSQLWSKDLMSATFQLMRNWESCGSSLFSKGVLFTLFSYLLLLLMHWPTSLPPSC